MHVVCDIVPPHLLEVLATSDDADTRSLASNTLSHTSIVRDRRRECLEAGDVAKSQSREQTIASTVSPDQSSDQTASPSNIDVPRTLLETVSNIQEDKMISPSVLPVQPSVTLNRKIYDMRNLEQKAGNNDETYRLLPGKIARSEGEGPVQDGHVNQAYENCAKVVKFYHQVMGYSFLGGNEVLTSSVHFEKGYQNASWLGDSIQQMVYGDGGGNLYNFTACLDIIGHEMTHAVVEHTCRLQYNGESGALNEHVADVFGMLVTLWSEQKPSAESDWLIGEGCLMPGIKGVALRNMKFPGTAYDDPQFGKDPQPASWSEIEDYKTKHRYWASFDHGSVHAFSGVPNRAFVLAAEAFGGFAWEKAGTIWWTTISSQRITSSCTFIQFASATVKVAEELFGEAACKIVGGAWEEVGLKTAEGTSTTDSASQAL